MADSRTDEIEVEVVEIDGVPPPRPQPAPGRDRGRGADWQDWRGWQGRVRRLDPRWWPLWTLLGLVLFVLLLTVGLLLGVCYLAWRTVRLAFASLLALLVPNRNRDLR